MKSPGNYWRNPIGPILFAATWLSVAALSSADTKPNFKPFTETIPETNLSFEMIPIPAGEFLMGSPSTETGRSDDEGPQVRVKVHAFWMAKIETTWDLYDLYYKNENIPEGDKRREEPVVSVDAMTRPTPHFTDDTWGHGREGKPTIGMTHHAAMMYCHWLSKKTGKTYRLPTEAEWEYACRAGSKTAYPWGDDPKPLGEHDWYAGNSEETTHEGGKKKANAFGLFDMNGNVGEWCIDHYSTDDYKQFPAGKLAVNPFRKPTTVKFSHVVRGGSWADEPPKCRSATRRGSDKTWLKRDPQKPQSIWWMTDCDWVGFRVVRPVEELPELKNFLPPVHWASRDSEK
jgi:formylglycine-generating enzyme required for sulfatase activity